MKKHYNHGAVFKVTREDTWESIEANFALMRECGLNTVVIWPAAFWWEEKKEGYPYNTGREILKIAERLGIEVIMELAGQLTVMEYIPDFLMKPEYYPTDLDGRRNGSQQAFGFLNYFHPEVKALIREHYRNTALAYKDYPALIGYDVFNETMFRSHDEYSMEDFRLWLREKYGTVEELNKAWERTYSDFSEVDHQTWKWMSVMPEADYAMWRRAAITRFLKPWCDAILEVDCKHMIIADNIHSQSSPLGAYARPQGDWALAEALDTIGMSFYPKQITGTQEPALRWEIFDGFASAARREGFYISEMQTHIQALFNQETCVLPEELYTWCLEAYAAGAKGLIYWMWRPFNKGLQTLGRGLVNYRGLPTERFAVARSLGEIFERYGALRPLRSKIGVLYHELSDDITRCFTMAYQVPENVYNLSVFGAYKAIFELNARADIITLSELDNYSAVVLANTAALGREDCRRLIDFVRRGGILITDGKLAAVDELGKTYDLIPGGGLDGLVGEVYFETDNRDSSFEFFGKKIQGFGGRDIPESVSGEVLASFSDGVAAVVKNSFGLGTSYAVNTQLLLGLERGKTDGAKEILSYVIRRHGLADFECPSDIKLRISENDEKYIVFAFNYSDAQVEGEIKLKFGGREKRIQASLLSGEIGIYEVEKR